MIPRTNLEDINETDIRRLIADEVREGRTLDFKETLDLSRDGRQALVEDVCAFANTVGGDLVFGLREAGGIANEVVPVVVPDLDAELLRLTNFLRDATEPRVTTMLLHHAVPLAGGGCVVVLRVAPSPNAPHRVIRNGQFYLRNSVGKEPMDIHAIRTAFAFGDSLADRAFAWRDQRLDAVKQLRGPLALPDEPLVVVHLVPIAALTRRDAHPVEALLKAAAPLQRAQPAGCAHLPPRVNFEGVICSASPGANGVVNGYSQLFREGCVELVGVLDKHGELGSLHLNPVQYERPLVDHGLPVIAQALASLEIPAPAYLFMSLLRVQSLQVIFKRQGEHHATYRPIPSHLVDIVALPVYLESFEGDWADIARPILDPLWNAIGEEHTLTNFANKP